MSDQDTSATALLEPDLATSETALAAAHVGGDVAGLTRYPGGKNGAGVWQRLIGMMPPHLAYVEPFLGSGAIWRRKRRAMLNIGIDVDAPTRSLGCGGSGGPRRR